MRSPFSPAARERYLRDYIPIRPAIAQFNRAHPGASIFLANDEDIADPLSDVYQDSWHQYNHLEQLRKARTLPEMTALFEKWGVHYFAWRKTDPERTTRPASSRPFPRKMHRARISGRPDPAVPTWRRHSCLQRRHSCRSS
jgi:hypothetical protein